MVLLFFSRRLDNAIEIIVLTISAYKHELNVTLTPVPVEGTHSDKHMHLMKQVNIKLTTQLRLSDNLYQTSFGFQET